MQAVALGEDWLSCGDIAAFARDGRSVSLSQEARARVLAAREVVEHYARSDAPIYGLNTGFGGNFRHQLSAEEIPGFQVRMLSARSVGVGAALPSSVCRAALLVRAHGMARGGAGVSPGVVDLAWAMLAAGVTPVIPCRGSIGAGDLGLSAFIGLVMAGRGEAWWRGERMPAAQALAKAGLAPAALGLKDGLGIVNASPVTLGLGALTLADLGDWLRSACAAAALSLEGFAGNPKVFDARLSRARPAGGQSDAAAYFRRLLAGSALHQPGVSRQIQDPLSFRCLAQITGATLAPWHWACSELETDLNGSADSPLVLVDDREMLSNGNFHTASLSVAFDSLAIALAPFAGAIGQRIVRLCTPAASELPRYLSRVGGASAGFVPLQKTAAALVAEVQLAATPVSSSTMPVSEQQEDHAPQTFLAARKLAAMLEPLRLLTAIEAMVAAQAIDLRPIGTQGEGSRRVHDAVRQVVPPLEADRETGPDADRVALALADRGFLDSLPALPRAPRGADLSPACGEPST